MSSTRKTSVRTMSSRKNSKSPPMSETSLLFYRLPAVPGSSFPFRFKIKKVTFVVHSVTRRRTCSVYIRVNVPTGNRAGNKSVVYRITREWSSQGVRGEIT